MIVSVEKISNNPNKLIYVRLQNKCIYFYGTFLKGTTEVTQVSPDSYESISVKKLLVTKDNKPALELVRIKFKDAKHGKLFLDKFKWFTNEMFCMYEEQKEWGNHMGVYDLLLIMMD